MALTPDERARRYREKKKADAVGREEFLRKEATRQRDHYTSVADIKSGRTKRKLRDKDGEPIKSPRTRTGKQSLRQWMQLAPLLNYLLSHSKLCSLHQQADVGASESGRAGLRRTVIWQNWRWRWSHNRDWWINTKSATTDWWWTRGNEKHPIIES